AAASLAGRLGERAPLRHQDRAGARPEGLDLALPDSDETRRRPRRSAEEPPCPRRDAPPRRSAEEPPCPRRDAPPRRSAEEPPCPRRDAPSRRSAVLSHG